MPKPPPTPPSSDIDGVNEDARVNSPSKRSDPENAKRLERGNEEGKGKPESDSGSQAIGG